MGLNVTCYIVLFGFFFELMLLIILILSGIFGW